MNPFWLVFLKPPTRKDSFNIAGFWGPGGYDLESQMRLVFTESGPSSATEENNSFYLELNVDSRKASWMADTWGVGK